MLTIIEKTARSDGGHGLQSQSHRTECWQKGWVAVPPTLERAVWDCGGYCELTLDEAGVLVGITPTDKPREETAPTELELLRADVDYLAVMTGVEL